jgi:hypothetical protein
MSANSQLACAASGERLRPFGDLASELSVRLHRPTQAVAVDAPTRSRQAARHDANHAKSQIPRIGIWHAVPQQWPHLRITHHILEDARPEISTLRNWKML